MCILGVRESQCVCVYECLCVCAYLCLTYMYLMFINLPQSNSTDMLFFFRENSGPNLDELYLDGAYLDGPNYGRFCQNRPY